MLIDCDHPNCSDALLEAILRKEALPILFSPFSMKAEVREVAARHGVRSFTPPTDSDTFRRPLEL